MRLAFLALRSILYASGLVWLWAWVAASLRRFDGLLGGPLPAWSGSLGFVVLPLGAILAAWCIGAFLLQGHGTLAHFDPPARLVAVGPYRRVRNPMYLGGALLLLGFGLLQRSPSMILFVAASPSMRSPLCAPALGRITRSTAGKRLAGFRSSRHPRTSASTGHWAGSRETRARPSCWRSSDWLWLAPALIRLGFYGRPGAVRRRRSGRV